MARQFASPLYHEVDEFRIRNELIVCGSATFEGSSTFQGTVDFENAIVEGMAPEEIIYGLSDLPCTLTVVHDGGTLYAEVEASGGGNILYNINGTYLTLDCTTGSGTGGKARVALTAGTQASPHINYIYVIESGPNAVLTASTTLPTGEFAWVGQVVVQDVTTFLAQGPMLIHANIESYSSNDRGKLSHMSEKLRALGIRWSSGIEPTTNITTNAGSADNVHLEVTEGEIYNLHRHTFPAKTTGPYYWGNGISATLYSEETDLNAFLSTTDGTSMSGLYFNLVVWGVSSSDTSDSKIFVNVPRDTYHNASNAQADVDNTADYTVPLDLQPSAFLIARICLRHQTSSNGTWTEVATYDLRGTPINSRTGGVSSATASNEFVDNLFRIYDDADATKHAAFEVSSITTGTTRTLTVPDQNGTLLVDDGSTAIIVGAPTTFSSNTTFSADLTFSDSGTVFLDASTGHLHLRTQTAAKDIILDSSDDIQLEAATDIYFDAAGDFWWRDASDSSLMKLSQAGNFDVIKGSVGTGSQGTTQGIVKAYGDATTNGGYLRLYNGATENGTIAYWDFRAEGSIATLGPDTDTDLMVFAGTYMQCRGANAFFGIDESVQCVGQFYGNATTGGGEVRWHQGGSENGTYQYYRGFANGDYWAFGNNVDAVTHFFYGDGGFLADGSIQTKGYSIVNPASGDARVRLYNNGSLRWDLYGNADTNFMLRRYNTSGVYVDDPIKVTTADGNVTFANDVDFDGTVDLTGSTASNVLKSSTGKLNLQTTTGGKNIEITTGSNAALIMDCGGNFTWRDRDGGYATRMTLNSATGELTGTGELSGWGPITDLNIHNNGGTGSAEAIASGTYTPTLTNLTNYSSVTGEAGHWTRVGNVVTVSLYLWVTHVSASTATSIYISLPISTNLGAASDCTGCVTWSYLGTSGSGAIHTDATGERAIANYLCGSGVTHKIRCVFTYLVQ